MRDPHPDEVASDSRNAPDGTAETPEEVLKPFPSDDLGLEYVANGNDSEGAPQDPCWLGGPRQTVALVKVESQFQTFWPDYDCSTPEPYASAYYEADVTVVRSYPSEALGYQQKLAPKLLDALVVFPEEVTPGDHLVVSLREAGGEWFAVDYLRVNVRSGTDAETVPTSQDLPATWSELRVELAKVHDDFDTLCTEPYQFGVSQVKLMNDGQFDTWAHTRQSPEPCGVPAVDGGGSSEPDGTTTTDPTGM